MKLKILLILIAIVVIAYFAFMYFDMYLDSKFDEIKNYIVNAVIRLEN